MARSLPGAVIIIHKNGGFMGGYADFDQPTVTGTRDLRHLAPKPGVSQTEGPASSAEAPIGPTKAWHLVPKPGVGLTQAIRSEKLGAMRVMHPPAHVCAAPPIGAHPAAA